MIKGSDRHALVIVMSLAILVSGCSAGTPLSNPARAQKAESQKRPEPPKMSLVPRTSEATADENVSGPTGETANRLRLYRQDPDFPIEIEYGFGDSKSRAWIWEDQLCVERRQVVSVTIKTLPKVLISIVATYFDGSPRDSYELAEASSDGRYDWEWIVPSDAALGNGLLVLSVRREDGESRPDDRQFRVSLSC